ncbi:MAG: hypothetical protein ACI4JZ_02825, partial [Oscillospiraceae bacterium]
RLFAGNLADNANSADFKRHGCSREIWLIMRIRLISSGTVVRGRFGLITRIQLISCGAAVRGKFG